MSRWDRERECVAVPFPHQSIVIACFMVIVCALWGSLCPHFYHLKDEVEHFSWGNDHSFFHRNANCHAMVTFVRWFSCSKFIHSEWWQRHSNEKKPTKKKRSNHKSAQNNGNIIVRVFISTVSFIFLSTKCWHFCILTVVLFFILTGAWTWDGFAMNPK